MCYPGRMKNNLTALEAPVEGPATTGPPLLAVDISVSFHHLFHSLKAAGVTRKDKNLKTIIQAHMAWLYSGAWAGLPVQPQVILLGDRKDSNLHYWRHDYLTRLDVTARMPHRYKHPDPKRKDSKRSVKVQRNFYPRLRQEALGLLEMRDHLTAHQRERWEHLSKTLAVAYKGGRAHPDPFFTKLKKLAYKVIEEQGWPLISSVGYEADDMAAGLCWLNNRREAPRAITLATVDTDWMGLISPTSRWFCLAGFAPRVRDMATYNTYCLKKFKKTFETPRDIWDHKAMEGDSSDALPPGSPIEVIDLHHPPKEYRAWKIPSVRRALEDALAGDSTGKPVGQAKAFEAMDYLRAQGIALTPKPALQAPAAITPKAA